MKAAVSAQLEKFSHTCFQITPYEGYVRLADRLNRLVPARGPAPSIGEIRRLGAMVALELIEDSDASRPATDLTKALVQQAAASGLIILACGTRGNVKRFLDPLTAEPALIDEGLDILEGCLRRLIGSRQLL